MKNKKVLVVGMGRSGISAVQALIGMGCSVSVQDSKKEDCAINHKGNAGQGPYPRCHLLSFCYTFTTFYS